MTRHLFWGLTLVSYYKYTVASKSKKDWEWNINIKMLY